MNRLWIRAALVALVITGSVVAAVHAATIVVDDDGVQCPGALTTIQGGVTTAAPGDTIRVCAGTYFEEVTIGTANLRLTAEGPVKLIAPLLTVSPVGFDVTAVGVQVDHFDISGYAQCGIRVTADGAAIQNNVVHNNDVNICVDGSANTRVRNNVVRAAAEDGISASNVTANEISGNRVSIADVGVFVTGDSGSTIHHNLVTDIRIFGIGLQSSAGGSIRNNTVRLVGGLGVFVEQSTDARIVSNSIQDSLAAGMLVAECVGCTVSRNSVNRNNPLPLFGGGIFLQDIDGSTIVQNAAHRNGFVDCSWDGAGTNVFVRNACDVEVPPGAWD